MKVLFLCTAFNSLSQRVALVLKSRGHAVTVELALSPELMISAADIAKPDIIICPFLTKRVPPAVYNRWLTLIVHPGPPGDAGPSALDWTLLGDLGACDAASAELAAIDAAHNATTTRRKMRSHWGVTVLQAIEAFDAGPVWAFDQFDLDEETSRMSKSELYRGPVTRAAVNAVLAAVEIIRIVATQANGQPKYSVELSAPDFARNNCVTRGLPFQGGKTHDRPLLKASSRDFLHLSRDDNHSLSADMIIQRVRCGDSQPGLLSNLFGTPLFLYNATIQKDPLPAHIAKRAYSGGPGTVLATRDGAVLVEVGADYPIWISHLRRPKTKADKYLHAKLPATMALLSIPEHATQLGLLSDVEEWSVTEGEGVDIYFPWQRRVGTYQQVWVELESFGSGNSQIGYIHAEFYNGAFSTSQCEMLLKAIRWTLAQPNLKAIVMLGGTGYFSNGIALNVIEGSSDPSAEGWANINAIDDCVQALLAPSGILTVAAIRGNAAAGGLALATAADVVICAESAVLNPHYRGIGLYGSEWHTYSWYERCGAEVAAKLVRDMLPMSSTDACTVGLVDHVIDNNKMNASQLLSEIKSVVENIMTSKSSTDNKHIGAPWTRPLRHTTNRIPPRLSDFMLQNKAKFLAYTFAGCGADYLSIAEHFQQYRKHELDQMRLDFFHPHRNARFASRCTAFVRKLVPSSTPSRFALHRRYEGGSWEKQRSKPVLQDDEELDDFDSLGQYPASDAVPRLPSSRPEYIREAAAVEEKGVRPDMLRNCSVSSTSSSLYSEVTLADSTPPSPSTKFPSDPFIGESLTTVASKISYMLGEQDTYHVVIANEHPRWVKPTETPTCHSSGISEPPIETNMTDKVQMRQCPQTLWSCYYSETGNSLAPESELEKTSELLDNMMRTT